MTLEELLGVMDNTQVIEVHDWNDKKRVGLAGELYMSLPENIPYLANSEVTYIQSGQTTLENTKRKSLEIDVVESQRG